MWELARDPSPGRHQNPGAQGVQGFFFGRPGQLPAQRESEPDSAVLRSL